MFFLLSAIFHLHFLLTRHVHLKEDQREIHDATTTMLTSRGLEALYSYLLHPLFPFLLYFHVNISIVSCDSVALRLKS